MPHEMTGHFRSDNQPMYKRPMTGTRTATARAENWVRLLARFLALISLLVPVCSWSAPRVGRHGIGHVFVIILENKSYADTFRTDAPAPYLAKTLTGQGALLAEYYAIGHSSLDNYIAMISGQPPNEDTQEDCPVFSEFVASEPGFDSMGRAVGRGCVYPAYVKTLAEQLERAHLTWRAYMEDMGNDPERERAACGHSAIGSPETLLEATVHDQYAVKHNPFVYFHSIIDDQAGCDSHVVTLKKLPDDLSTPATTPNFAFITPNLCHDGHDSPCVNGEPGGFSSADGFLRAWVPLILKSPAFREDGLLVVTFDEAEGDSARIPSLAVARSACPGRSCRRARMGPGRPGRRGLALSLHQARDCFRTALQPLWATAHGRGHLPLAALGIGGRNGRAELWEGLFVAAANCCAP